MRSDAKTVPAKREKGKTKARMRVVELGGPALATARCPLFFFRVRVWNGLVGIERGDLGLGFGWRWR